MLAEVVMGMEQFQSTPSARRATVALLVPPIVS